MEEIRQSKLPANTAIVSRAIGLISDACLAFERLRVIREYRSPRSIRSFNKVFIMLFPIILAPHLIMKGRQERGGGCGEGAVTNSGKGQFQTPLPPCVWCYQENFVEITIGVRIFWGVLDPPHPG